MLLPVIGLKLSITTCSLISNYNDLAACFLSWPLYAVFNLSKNFQALPLDQVPIKTTHQQWVWDLVDDQIWTKCNAKMVVNLIAQCSVGALCPKSVRKKNQKCAGSAFFIFFACSFSRCSPNNWSRTTLKKLFCWLTSLVTSNWGCSRINWNIFKVLRWKPGQPNVKYEKENRWNPRSFVYFLQTRSFTEKFFTDDFYLSGYFRGEFYGLIVSLRRMNTFTSRDQFKAIAIRIGEDLVVNYVMVNRW